jgi:nucleotide-binding universal stress UspA family protein
MDFKTILVNLNHEARVPELIAAAAAIAKPAKAHVIGLYVMPPVLVPSDMIIPMGPEIYREQIASHRAQAKNIESVFEKLTRGEPYGAEWRIHGNPQITYQPIANGVIAEARTAELVIVSQGTGDKGSPMLAEVAERVGLESGRPVLVVPTAWKPRECGRDITVAWDSSREAARAAFDALPLLARASRVRLITVGRQQEVGTNANPASELASTMARHGLNLEVQVFGSESRHTGDTILTKVESDGSDLLVMGVYGHSRLREFILGGATRDVLKNMTVPVLMSH